MIKYWIRVDVKSAKELLNSLTFVGCWKVVDNILYYRMMHNLTREIYFGDSTIVLSQLLADSPMWSEVTEEQFILFILENA